MTSHMPSETSYMYIVNVYPRRPEKAAELVLHQVIVVLEAERGAPAGQGLLGVPPASPTDVSQLSDSNGWNPVTAWLRLRW